MASDDRHAIAASLRGPRRAESARAAALAAFLSAPDRTAAPDLNAADTASGLTPLAAAVVRRRFAVARVLVRHGADPFLAAPRHDRSPFVLACGLVGGECGFQAIEFVLWALRHARAAGPAGPVLVDRLLNVSVRETGAARGDEYASLALHCVEHPTWLPLLEALLSRRAGLDPEAATWDDGSLLHAAVRRGNVPAARALIEHGADVDARCARRGWTPLQCAVAHRRFAAVRLLLERGADAALVCGAPEPGADDDAARWQGATAADIAAAVGCPSLAAHLGDLARGTSVPWTTAPPAGSALHGNGSSAP